MRDAEALRRRMVERQLRRRGIRDERVLEAMGSVPRERFVPADQARHAYADRALRIGSGQTISQPWIVAAICQGLELAGDETVLEVGTGSGYSTAVVGHLAGRVVSLERHRELVDDARTILAELGVSNAEVRLADGSVGLAELAPYDAIAVHATAPGPPAALFAQLREGGRLVAPIAAGVTELLTVYRRRGDAAEAEVIGPCRFVPLIGAEGFPG